MLCSSRMVVKMLTGNTKNSTTYSSVSTRRIPNTFEQIFTFILFFLMNSQTISKSIIFFNFSQMFMFF